MGLLDKLWDDTLAGPRPDSGLSRLRKPPSFCFSSSSSSSPGVVSPVGAATPTAAAAAAAAVRAGNGGEGISVITGPQTGEETRVTRSIMIKRPPGWSSPGSGTPPSSPASSTPPPSPFAGAGGAQRFRRKSMSDSMERRRSPSELPVADSSSSSTYPPFDV
ncbi:dormancy-associated protein homolog 3-like [Zingiber officinale]|uniref:dormancy-associated protein homolog 3-like n=1 Tax=Zingiber officinale TaxID=94328 RepID=UPI001C4AA5DD|nr:dormancy-associated protein homolog 3-like [Zingiber officinale]